MKRLDAGFSLIELLVCFFISMLLISILIQHLLSVGRQYQHLHMVLDETIELQWVFDMMRARIRHAGFTPCVGLNQLHVIDTRDARDSPGLLKAIEVQQGEEPRLVIQKMDETAFGLAEILAPNQLRAHQNSLKPNQPVIISDCTHAEIHEIQKIGEIIQLNKPLVFDYSSEVYVGRWVSEAFFFRKPKGLFIKQQRVDYMAPAKSIEFMLNNAKLSMRLHSKLGKTYVLEEQVRI
jgi:hypothetical protein